MLLSGRNGHLSKLSFDKLIHNADESDYVGLPGGGGGGGGGCFTETASLFVDFSSGSNPYHVMLEYNWEDGSFEDVPASSIVSGNSAMVQINASANGDMATIIPAADGQGHLVAINGPPTSVTDCPACSADNVTPTGTVPVPGNPAQLLVIGDTTTFPTNCPNTKIRTLAYQIQDASSPPNDVTMDVPTKEQFAMKSANSCNTAITTSETCTGTPGGIIHDTLTVGCNSVGGSCGYTYSKQQWVWCHEGISTVIGTVGDLIVHNNAISVNGSFTSIKGTIIKP